MLDPLVSVIIPTFNRPKMLQDAIKSVINQTYKNLEIIVINDGGEDVSELIYSLQDIRLVYLQNAKQMGPGVRNVALEHSTGFYIAYLDDDDIFYPEHIMTLVNALRGSDYKVAYTDWDYEYKRLEEDSWVTYKKENRTYDMNFPNILINNILPLHTVMHARLCLDHVGLFDSSLQRYEDWDLWIRMLKEYPFLHIPKATVSYSRFDNPEFGQKLSLWIGYFIAPMQRIHSRYKTWAEKISGIEAAQQEARNRLRYRALTQLEEMSDGEMEQIMTETTVRELVDISLVNTENDIREIRALLGYCTQRLPDNAFLWMQFAKLCRVLGDYRSASIAINRALQLKESPEIQEELSALLAQCGLNKEYEK